MAFKAQRFEKIFQQPPPSDRPNPLVYAPG
jgi:hypothetical protein